MRRTALSVVAVLAMMGFLVACDPPPPAPPDLGAQPTLGYHPAGQYPPKFDFQLTPGEPNGAVIGGVRILDHNNSTDPTLCMNGYQMSDGGAAYLCRVMKGLRPWSTEGPWVFPYNAGLAIGSSQGAVVGGYYGYRVQRAGANATYEGCKQVGAFGAQWQCDYHTVGYIMRPHGVQAGVLGWAQMNLWDWSRYTVTNLACAGDIASGWYFAPLTVVKINDCIQEPWVR